MVIFCLFLPTIYLFVYAYIWLIVSHVSFSVLFTSLMFIINASMEAYSEMLHYFHMNRFHSFASSFNGPYFAITF